MKIPISGKNPRGPAARPLCKRGLLGDFSALVPTTAAHFHARCCTESYMNYSVVKICQLMPVAELGGRFGFASGAETGLAVAGCLKSLSTFASSVGASSRNSVTGRALVK